MKKSGREPYQLQFTRTVWTVTESAHLKSPDGDGADSMALEDYGAMLISE